VTHVLRRAACAAIAIVALFVAAAFVAVRRPLPPRTGTHALPALEAPVEIAFDARALPHVRARTTHDAFRALGWLHAGDRFFQMEMRRRAARGRLSEALGPAAFATDVESRREAHGSLAERDLDALSSEESEIVRAYTEGVNAYLVSHARPLELAALGIQPQPWTPEDSLAVERLMYAFLSDSGERERGVLDAVAAHGLDVALEALALEDGRPPHRPPIENVPLAPLDQRPVEPPAGGASNAFALAGTRTSSGKPLLGSDPHLPLEPIPIWYAAHLTSADGLDVAGVTLAGLPFVAIGHNGRVAWGITMQQADDTDLFLERDGGATRRETILVKGEGPRSVLVGETARGPVIGRAGVAFVAEARASRGAPVGVAAFLRAARARGGEELRAAFRLYQGPPINVVWADVAGHIGMQAAGALPLRRSGDGRVPTPAWTGAYGWTGLRAAGDLPSIEDPVEGFVASGNDDWSQSGRPLPYPGHYLGHDRIARLREVLSATSGGDVAAVRALQGDLVSLYARRVAAAMAAMRFEDPAAERAREVLARWDGRADMRGPSLLFYAAMVEIRRAAPGSRERSSRAALPIGWDGLAEMIVNGAGASFWDDPETPDIEARERVVGAALARALARAEREDGANPRFWSFGRRHQARFDHPFSSALPALRPFLDLGPVALPGEWSNPRVAGFSLRRGTYGVVHIQSMRMIVDLGDVDASRFVLPLGQSGQVADRHRADQLETWAAGEDFAFPFTRAAVDAATLARIRLVP
jgi:penicillin amidase